MTHEEVAMSHWLGLRPEDLTESEREALAGDPVLAERHAEELALGAEVATLDAPTEGPEADRVLARLEARKQPPRGGGRAGPAGLAVGLGLAAAVLLTWLPAGEEETSPMRDRGPGASPATVVLRAAAEGPRGLRVLRSGDIIGLEERVVFEVWTSSEGFLVLRDADSRALLDPERTAPWSASAGRHPFGRPAPLSWRPDVATDTTLVQVAWCPEPPADPAGDLGAACVTSELALRWER